MVPVGGTDAVRGSPVVTVKTRYHQSPATKGPISLVATGTMMGFSHSQMFSSLRVFHDTLFLSLNILIISNK